MQQWFWLLATVCALAYRAVLTAFLCPPIQLIDRRVLAVIPVDIETIEAPDYA